MKKLLFAFAFALTTFTASAQFDVSQDYSNDSTFTISFNAAPKIQLTENRKCDFYSDTVRLTSLEPGRILSTANTIVCVDAFGRLFPVSKSSLVGTYIEATKGSTTFSGITLQTQYTVTHGLSYTPSSVFIQPKSTNAAALSYVDNITSTTFRITFLTVPILGTNNLSFNWIAYK